MSKFNALKILALLILIVPVIVHGQGVGIPDVGLPGSPSDEASDIILNFITGIALPFAGIIAVLFIIIGGFQIMLAGVNEGLAKRGKETLRNAIVGLIVIILSYVIITVVVNTLFNRI